LWDIVEPSVLVSIPRRFYCCGVNFKVIQNNRGRFSTDASNHFPDLFQWRLAIQSRDVLSPTILLCLPDDSPGLCLKGPEVVQVIALL
jgi:hypothetical protein